LFIVVDSRLKISLEKKSRQIQAETSDFILNPGLIMLEKPRSAHCIEISCKGLDPQETGAACKCQHPQATPFPQVPDWVCSYD